MSDTNPESSNFNALNTDVTESILSLLPIPSLVRFSSVSKLWRSIITSLPPSPSPSPWLFLFGIHNTSSFHNQSFAFDPLSNSWLRLPFPPSLPSLHLLGSDRFLFTTAPRFSFSPFLKPNWRFTSPVPFPRINPLLAVFSTSSSSNLILLVGGVGSIGGLVNIDDRLPVQIYDSALDSWQLCPPLPQSFPSHESLSSALCKRRFYVFDINSSFISSFSLDTHTWSDVQTLRPPGLLFAFLNSCGDDTLVLGGMCNSSDRGFSFNLWRIEEGSMEFSEIAIMPEALLFGLVGDNEDEDDGNRFRSLKCVGAGCLVYVFNEDGHKKYPACVCEIGLENGGKCRWRSVPPLPSPVNKFHKLVSFCSTVSITDVFHSDATHIGA